MLVREFTTRNWCCFFTWKLPLPPCIEPGITLYCPSFMHFAHPTVHLPKHMHLCSNSSKQWHMLLMCKKSLDIWKKERCMEYLNVSGQCAAGFVLTLSEADVGPSDFFNSTSKVWWINCLLIFFRGKISATFITHSKQEFCKISLVIFCKYHKVTLLFC